MRDDRPARYKGETVRTAGRGSTAEQADLRSAREFVRNRRWERPLVTEYRYRKGAWRRVE